MLAGAAAARPGISKGFRLGTHRVCPPATTLSRVAPLLAGMGVTRVANLTGLDRIGLPVVAAYRPNSRSLAVHQGKGLDLAAAKASAVMEAVEFWHAEHVLKPLLWARVGDLASRHPVVDLDRLPRRRGRTGGGREPLLWIEGLDLMQGTARWLPYELVHADYTLPRAPGSGIFQATTNGLASGNHLREAQCHALAEVIERDARALWWLLDDAAKAVTRLDLAAVDDQTTRSVIDTYARAGFAVAVWDITTDVRVPAFLCRIADNAGQASGGAGFYGSGAHAERSIALLRALLEAAQSRLTTIAGARDDFRPDEYAQYAAFESAAFAQLDSAQGRAGRRFADVPSLAADSFDADLEWMLQRLTAVGIKEVVSVELSRPELGVPVVRIVVPGLEGMHTKTNYTPGARAQVLLAACP